MPRPADTPADRVLIEAARDVIRNNYDHEHEDHTVGAAVRCASGRVFRGVNVYSLHGSCAEFVAIGSAITAGERGFVALACVRGTDGSELIPPCGNCRQMLIHYSPGCEVLLPGESGPVKVPARELLPYAYRRD